jgi:hypothetical protein
MDESAPLSVFALAHESFIEYSNLYKITNTMIKKLRGREPSVIPQMQEDEQNLRNDVFKKELHDLGEALVFKMREESLKHGAVFVLVTRINELYEASLRKHMFSIDVSKQLSNPRFSLPDNLRHINESGNGVLAWEIAKFLQTNQLIPANYFKAE